VNVSLHKTDRNVLKSEGAPNSNSFASWFFGGASITFAHTAQRVLRVAARWQFLAQVQIETETDAQQLLSV
jgi:hypothetical protein